MDIEREQVTNFLRHIICSRNHHRHIPRRRRSEAAQSGRIVAVRHKNNLWSREEGLEPKLTPSPPETGISGPRAHDGRLTSPVSISRRKILPEELTESDDKCDQRDSYCNDS
jgi:hypothetical protein